MVRSDTRDKRGLRLLDMIYTKQSMITLYSCYTIVFAHSTRRSSSFLYSFNCSGFSSHGLSGKHGLLDMISQHKAIDDNPLFMLAMHTIVPSSPTPQDDRHPFCIASTVGSLHCTRQWAPTNTGQWHQVCEGSVAQVG